MNNSLFAHMFSGMWLAGSPLEGLPCGTFPEYLLKYLDTEGEIKSIYTIDDKNLIRTLNPFKEKLGFFIEISKLFEGKSSLDNIVKYI